MTSAGPQGAPEAGGQLYGSTIENGKPCNGAVREATLGVVTAPGAIVPRIRPERVPPRARSGGGGAPGR